MAEPIIIPPRPKVRVRIALDRASGRWYGACQTGDCLWSTTGTQALVTVKADQHRDTHREMP